MATNIVVFRDFHQSLQADHRFLIETFSIPTALNEENVTIEIFPKRHH
jgi:hypothetical protein